MLRKYSVKKLVGIEKEQLCQVNTVRLTYKVTCTRESLANFSQGYSQLNSQVLVSINLNYNSFHVL